jgi:hypothetical protein
VESTVTAAPHTHPKNKFARKKIANFCENHFFIKKQKWEKEFENFTFGNSNLIKHEICGKIGLLPFGLMSNGLDNEAQFM